LVLVCSGLNFNNGVKIAYLILLSHKDKKPQSKDWDFREIA